MGIDIQVISLEFVFEQFSPGHAAFIADVPYCFRGPTDRGAYDAALARWKAAGSATVARGPSQQLAASFVHGLGRHGVDVGGWTPERSTGIKPAYPSKLSPRGLDAIRRLATCVERGDLPNTLDSIVGAMDLAPTVGLRAFPSLECIGFNSLLVPFRTGGVIDTVALSLMSAAEVRDEVGRLVDAFARALGAPPERMRTDLVGVALNAPSPVSDAFFTLGEIDEAARQALEASCVVTIFG